MSHATVTRARYRDLFSVAEFRALWLAQLLSVAGDQLARVAMTVLVYDRTQSALLAGVTYAATIIPAFAGGVLLSGAGDRLPRRAVMIACDLARFALVLAMAAPQVPLQAMVGLLFAVTALNSPFGAARSAIYPDILAGEEYVLGTSVTMTTYQAGLVIGFAAGGALTGLAGARPCLLADAATFAVSALVVWRRVRPRPAADTAARRLLAPLADAAAGTRLVFGNPALRAPVLFGWLAAFAVVPEGLAAPLARSLRGGPVLTGAVLAGVALGIAAGSIVFGRLAGPQQRGRWMAPLALASCIFLALFALRPAAVPALLLLCASGACCCYQMAANSAFVAAAPPARRSQAFGLALAGMYLGQGAAVIVAGAAATRWEPSAVISASGATGAALVLALVLTSRRSARETRVDAAGRPPAVST